MWTPFIDKAVTILLTGGVLAFVEFLIKRRDDRKDKKDGLAAAIAAVKSSIEALKTDMDKKFRKSERDQIRTQLLVLIKISPTEQQEILTVGEHYFKTLHGDWYMTTLFNRWLTENKIGKPDWFKEE